MKILPNNIAVIEGDTHLSKWIEETGRLDHDAYLLPQILPFIKEGDTVIDGGACIGDHTIAYLRYVGPTGNVVAFEPNPQAYECLLHNCPDAICMPYGLTDEACEFVSIHQQSNVGATYCSSVEDGIGAVKCTSIDFYNPPSLHFLKLDIEGFELKALRGAQETIRKNRPVMLLEINSGALARNGHTPQMIYDFLLDMRYRFRTIPENCKLYSDPQFDLLCEPI